MAKDRFHDGWAPVIPHLARSNREVGDLRKDLETALEKIAEEVAESVPTVEITGPDTITTTGVVTIKILDSPGGDLVDKKVILSAALYQEVVPDSDLPGSIAETTVIKSAAKGLLLRGADSQAVAIQTDETGECQLNLEGYVGEKVIVACREGSGGPSLNCTGMHTVQVN